MNKIPVSFSYHEKTYSGDLVKVSGGGNLYHLYVNGYYQGQLSSSDQGWQFSTQKHGIVQELSMYFGNIIKLSQ